MEDNNWLFLRNILEEHGVEEEAIKHSLAGLKPGFVYVSPDFIQGILETLKIPCYVASIRSDKSLREILTILHKKHHVILSREVKDVTPMATLYLCKINAGDKNKATFYTVRNTENTQYVVSPVRSSDPFPEHRILVVTKPRW